MVRNFTLAGTAIAALTFTSGAAFADSISPETFEAELGLGKSVTIKKTVVVSMGDPDSAQLDAHFLFDTSGSMGPRINAAKAAAEGILAGLDAFGDAAGGVGAYAEAASLTNPAPGNVINLDINSDTSNGGAVDTAIQAITLNDPDGGGDIPENGNTAIERVANNASWRTGSSRFLFVFGDAGFKDETDTTDTEFTSAPLEAITSDAAVMAALAANDVRLFGLGTAGSFATSITDLGGTFFASGTNPDEIVDQITAGISGSFADYNAVTVNDLGGGLPGVSVSTVCTGADIGECVGADAIGDYDRSEERTFTFDVTFTNTGLLPGDSVTFPTFALVDSSIVAREIDTISAPIPLPAAAWLLMGGLGGLAALRRRKS